jgi:hypothetical protein
VAIALRTLWERHVRGPSSGLTSVTVFPVGLFIDAQQWLALADRCPWRIRTTDATARTDPNLTGRAWRVARRTHGYL